MIHCAGREYRPVCVEATHGRGRVGYYGYMNAVSIPYAICSILAFVPAIVLHEMGQALHAFDADEIKGNAIHVRYAKAGEKFVTLDGVEREMNERDLMIANTEEAMCIAGVFGGLKSGVTEKTKNVFLESAYFDPVTIRKTSRRHQLQTDASFRYERGCDPQVLPYAIRRAAQLTSLPATGTDCAV